MKKVMRFLLMMMLITLTLTGCSQTINPKDQVNVELLEVDGVNAIKVTSTGEWPVKIKITVRVKSDNMIVDTTYKHNLYLNQGESTLITSDEINKQITGINSYWVELVPKVYDFSAYAIILGVIALIICIIVVIYYVDTSTNGAEWVLGLLVIFGCAVMVLYITALIATIVTPGPIICQIFGYNLW